MVVIDKMIQKEVMVAPRFMGEPARGHRIIDVIIEPPEVMVFGPELRVQDLASIPTLPINVNGRREPFRQRTELSPDGLADLSIKKRYVEVEVHVGPEALEEEP